MSKLIDETQHFKLAAFFASDREVTLSRTYVFGNQLIWDRAELVRFLRHIRSSAFHERTHRGADLESGLRMVESLPDDLVEIFVTYATTLTDAHLRSTDEARLKPIKAILLALERRKVQEFYIDGKFCIPIEALSLFTDQVLALPQPDADTFVLEESFAFLPPPRTRTLLPYAPYLVFTINTEIFPPAQSMDSRVGLDHKVPIHSKVDCSLAEFFCFMLLIKQADELFRDLHERSSREEAIRHQLRKLPEEVADLAKRQQETMEAIAALREDVATVKQYPTTIHRNLGTIYNAMKGKPPPSKKGY